MITMTHIPRRITLESCSNCSLYDLNAFVFVKFFIECSYVRCEETWHCKNQYILRTPKLGYICISFIANRVDIACMHAIKITIADIPNIAKRHRDMMATLILTQGML